MEFSAKQIAAFIQGEILGDENATVHTFAKMKKEYRVPFLFWLTPNTPLIYIQHSQALC
jgi:UDP-3-O-[3-hydroxymyristoyl] glucosamine N-acyltransferase